MNWDSEAERSLWADVCRKSFWHFCCFAMGYDNPDFKWFAARVHRPFCDWFQAHAEKWLQTRGGEHQQSMSLMVVVMREFGKTMIITKAGQLWLHLRAPDLSTYIGSATVTRAQQFLDPIKVVLKGDDPNSKFTWLYGNWYQPDRTWSQSEIVHGARVALARSEPSIGTWGVETGLTSTHPDGGFMDDPIDYEIMGKDGRWLEKVNTHLTSLTPVFKVDSFFVYTGTRYHDADAIGELLRLQGARTVTGIPMPGVLAREDGKWDVYFMPGRGRDGKPIYPENWPEARLKEFESKSSLIYSAQILQDPNTGQHVVLAARQIEALWVEAKDIPRNLRHSIHLDTAFKDRTSGARGDSSVIEHWGHTVDGSGVVYYIEGYGSNKWRVEDYNTQLMILLQRLRRERQWPFMLTDEMEIGGKYGTWELTLQTWCANSGIPAPRIELLSRAGKKKVNRIMQAANYWVDGQVRLVRGAPGVENLVDQMLRIGTSTHDDWADAGADVFHPEVYRPARLQSREDQPALLRPWDDELLGSAWGRESASEIDWGREPIQ